MRIENLIGIIPDSVIEQLPETCRLFNITTSLRLSHFLSQCSHESGNFKHVRENLNYSSDGLKKTFPKYFPDNLSESYSRNPEKIASRVYGGRMGNGGEESKDGFKYRGGGYLHLTGKENYKKFGEYIGVDLITNPELVATKYPLSSAAFFFNNNKIWDICDEGSSDEVIKKVTKKINGGLIGIQDRIDKFNKFYEILHDKSPIT